MLWNRPFRESFLGCGPFCLVKGNRDCVLVIIELEPHAPIIVSVYWHKEFVVIFGIAREGRLKDHLIPHLVDVKHRKLRPGFRAAFRVQ